MPNPNPKSNQKNLPTNKNHKTNTANIESKLNRKPKTFDKNQSKKYPSVSKTDTKTNFKTSSKNNFPKKPIQRLDSNLKQDTTNLENPTSWGSVASWYDKMVSDKDSYQNQIIVPKILDILDLKQGEVVLDLGCGVGYFCQKYSQKGAKVVGVDIGKESIAVAKEKTDPSIEYYSHTAESIPFIKNSSVDKITIVLALQNIQKAEQVIAECGRVLKKNGQLVIVINHPYYRIPKATSWVWSDREFCQYRRVDRYLSSFEATIDMHPGKTKDAKNLTMSFHRPLQWYIQKLSQKGILVNDLQEWISHRITDQGPKKTPALEQSRKEIPLFMCISGLKV
jgi:ubiquinone/menaquinone biosynthesis C-methylase UbiE